MGLTKLIPVPVDFDTHHGLRATRENQGVDLPSFGIVDTDQCDYVINCTGNKRPDQSIRFDFEICGLVPRLVPFDPNAH